MDTKARRAGNRRLAMLASLGAVMVIVATGIFVGCAESKLQKQIDAQNGVAAQADTAAAAAGKKAEEITTAANAAAASADLAGQAAARKAAELDAATRAAAQAAQDAGDTDGSVFYAELQKRLADPDQKSKIAAAVGSGTTPAAAASTLIAQAQADAAKFAAEAKATRDQSASAIAAAQADAAKYAAEAKAAREQVATLTSQLAAAHEKDTQSWMSGITTAGNLANLWLPGASLIVGGLGTIAVQKIRGTTYADGQTDGATQVAQGVALMRKTVPALDHALNTVAPLLKLAVANTMDEHVAQAVADNRDTPPADVQSTIATLTTATPATPLAAAA